MTTRPLFLLPALFIGTCAMAQEGALDIRHVPIIDEPVIMGPIIDAATPQEPDSNAVFIVMEEMPSFPGGMPALVEFISQELRYPEEARTKGLVGKVFVTFVVERDGTISGIKVLRGIGSGCDEEAVRVVQQMPAWKPGQQSGKPVRVQFNLPISFKLADR